MVNYIHISNSQLLLDMSSLGLLHRLCLLEETEQISEDCYKLIDVNYDIICKHINQSKLFLNRGLKTLKDNNFIKIIKIYGRSRGMSICYLINLDPSNKQNDEVLETIKNDLRTEKKTKIDTPTSYNIIDDVEVIKVNSSNFVSPSKSTTNILAEELPKIDFDNTNTSNNNDDDNDKKQTEQIETPKSEQIEIEDTLNNLLPKNQKTDIPVIPTDDLSALPDILDSMINDCFEESEKNIQHWKSIYSDTDNSETKENNESSELNPEINENNETSANVIVRKVKSAKKKKSNEN